MGHGEEDRGEAIGAGVTRDGRAVRLAVVATLGLLAAVARAEAQGEAQAKAPSRPSVMARAMRIEVEGVSMEVTRGGAREKVELGREPAYRFDDPARDFLDGMIWACGRPPGRPVALLTISVERKPGNELFWLHELTSLTADPLTASGSGWKETWEATGTDLAFVPIPKAPAPAADQARRLRQMKELIRGVKAYELQDPGPARDELRLLPQPVLRYADPASGLVDGAIFLLAYGTNPEAALLVEARRAGSSEPTWSIGLARITTARMRVELDGRALWDWPGKGTNSAREPYWYYLKPIGKIEP